MEINDVIKKIQKKDYKDYFKSIDTKNVKDDKAFDDLFEKKIKPIISEKAVLGIDIYHYSQYEEKKQVLIPVAFKMIIDEAIAWCKEDEEIIFDGFDWDNYPFIDTGDGGFFIFDNPLQAYTFALNFYIQLKVFNSGHLYPKMHHYLDDITLRSCITYDDIYKLGDNYYGAAIINNSRILSTDKLNRFLIDENTNSWFNSTVIGIDRMKYFTLDQLYKKEVQARKAKGLDNHSLYREDLNETERKVKKLNKKDKNEKFPFVGIESVHIQKIGTIQVKTNVLSIYNVETQVTSVVSDENDSAERLMFVTTVGNLNPSGLSV